MSSNPPCAPQGRLLIANFVPDGYSRAYIELFMDWHLIVRDDAEMAALAGHAGPGSVRVFRDPHDNVVYAQWRRAWAVPLARCRDEGPPTRREAPALKSARLRQI